MTQQEAEAFVQRLEQFIEIVIDKKHTQAIEDAVTLNKRREQLTNDIARFIRHEDKKK